MGKIKFISESENAKIAVNFTMVKKESKKILYAQKVANACVIAKPMAPQKLSRKCFKLIKKAAQHKTYIRNGLKDVQKRIRKGEKGIVIFAGDIDPIDIMIHLPAVCENKDIPYCYIPSRSDLAAALEIKGGTIMVLVKEKEDYKQLFDEVKQEISNLAVELWI